CWRNAAGLSPEIAALQEPFGNAVHAALAGPLTDNTVAIFARGPIGLCALGIARAEGSAAVFGVEPKPTLPGRADRVGASGDIGLPEHRNRRLHATEHVPIPAR